MPSCTLEIVAAVAAKAYSRHFVFFRKFGVSDKPGPIATALKVLNSELRPDQEKKVGLFEHMIKLLKEATEDVEIGIQDMMREVDEQSSKLEFEALQFEEAPKEGNDGQAAAAQEAQPEPEQHSQHPTTAKMEDVITCLHYFKICWRQRQRPPQSSTSSGWAVCIGVTFCALTSRSV